MFRSLVSRGVSTLLRGNTRPTSTSVHRTMIGAALQQESATVVSKTAMVTNIPARRYMSVSPSICTVDNPYTGDIFAEIEYFTPDRITRAVDDAAKCQKQVWRKMTLEQRIDVCRSFMKNMVDNRDVIASDISSMMGKTLTQAQGELSGMLERCEAMIAMAPAALADDTDIPQKDGFQNKIAREPVGVVLVIAPWNYPLLTSVNAIIPAILAGNTVLIKHSNRTPLVADHFQRAFLNAPGAPEHLVQALHANHAGVEHTFNHSAIGYAHFTGSVRGGHQVYQNIAKKRFIDIGLELGGKDAAYVAEDADLDFAVPNVVDGSFYNAGQSCCGIERVYVHESKYEQFLEKAVAVVNDEYKLGDPQDAETSMGPMALQSSLDFLTQQVADAVEDGAVCLIGGSDCTDDAGFGRFFRPTIVSQCTQKMSIMQDESFGPIMAVSSVASDEEALRCINDSEFGLTASLWTNDVERANRLAPEIETGTIFLNRCDYLDPYLAWTGVKDTGKGISLSKYGFHAVTRVKSYHFRLPA